MTSGSRRHGLDRAAPQVTDVHQDVVLVHEGQVLARGAWARAKASRATRSTPKAVLTDTSLATSCGCRADGAAVADVRSLGAFTDDHEVDLTGLGQGDFTPGYSLPGRRLT